MKVVILRTLLIVLILLSDFTIYSQKIDSPYSGSIIVGTNRRFIISTYLQEPIKAKIIALYDGGIIIKERNGNTHKIDRNSITNIEEITYGTIGNAGFGIGVPYGMLGFNLEINALPFLSFSGGVGTTIFAGIGYNIGARGYFRKPGPVWRPRLSVFYGINGVYAEDFNRPDNEAFTGLPVAKTRIRF